MRRVFQIVGEAWTVTGAALYVAGWLFFQRFYGAFGTIPEAAGISFGFVVTRVVLSVIAVLSIIVFLVFLTGGVKGNLKDLDFSTVTVSARYFLYAFAALQLLLASIGALAIVYFRPWRNEPLVLGLVVTLTLVALFVLALYYEATAVLRLAGFTASSNHVKVGWSAMVWIGAVLSYGGLVGAFIYLAGFAADRVKAGNEIVVPGFRAERSTVYATPVSPKGPNLDGVCVIFLGRSSGSMIVFDFDSKLTYQLSEETTLLSRSEPSC